MSRAVSDPIDDSCSLTGHRGLVIGDLLYIQGGRMVYDGVGYGQNPFLRVLNLTETVKRQDVADFITTVEETEAPFFYDVAKIQNTRHPLFWLDETTNKVYLALGAELGIENTTHIEQVEYNPGEAGKMWTADLVDGGILTNWEEVDMRIGGRRPNLIGTSANWFDQTTRTGYAFGGSWLDYTEADNYINQLVTFNAANGTWTNETTPYSQSPGGFLEGIVLDDRPVLIAGGGLTNGQQGMLDTIRIYDTASKEWFTQRTNGDTPPARYWTMCTTIVAAQDKSSYQIILYGGATNDDTYGDVWALSIPSFTWTLLSEDISSDFAAGTRYSPSCNLMKKHTMVVVGGDHTVDGYTYSFPICDEEGSLAFFFDLNVLEWVSEVSGDEAEEYRVPAPVYEMIGGSAEGGATLTQPPGGFNRQALSTVFAAFASSTSPTNPAITDGQGSPTPKAEASTPISGGAIGGIVVGSIAGIALIVAGIWFLLFKKKRGSRDSLEAPPNLPPPDKGYYGYRPANPDSPPANYPAYVPSATELQSNPVRVELPTPTNAPGYGYPNPEQRAELLGSAPEPKYDNRSHLGGNPNLH